MDLKEKEEYEGKYILYKNSLFQDHIIFINLFCTPGAADRIVSEYPNLTVLTTELHPVTPNHFGQRYFRTDHVD